MYSTLHLNLPRPASSCHWSRPPLPTIFIGTEGVQNFLSASYGIIRFFLFAVELGLKRVSQWISFLYLGTDGSCSKDNWEYEKCVRLCQPSSIFAFLNLLTVILSLTTIVHKYFIEITRLSRGSTCENRVRTCLF